MATPIRGILWDIDGTLLDSNDEHAEAFRLALEEAGRHFPFGKIRRLIGMGADNLLPTLLREECTPELYERIDRRKGEIFKSRFLPKLRPFPMARQLVREIGRRGLKMAVATSASEEDLEAFLGIIGVERELWARTTGDDVESSKPDPDVIQAALHKLGLRPDEAIMIGDTPYDIASARRAGVRIIALRSGGWKDADLQGAEAVYQGPGELYARLDESPVFVTSSGSARPVSASSLMFRL